ncbi:MAG: hypothetical protein ABIH24_04250, partial [Verrucomicrobiota bacterium]
NLVESNPPLIQFIRSFYFSPVFRPDIITELNLKSRAFQHQRILKRCGSNNQIDKTSGVYYFTCVYHPINNPELNGRISLRRIV